MAAALSGVSVTAGDIRGELSYLTGRLCSRIPHWISHWIPHWIPHWITHWIPHWIPLESELSAVQSCDGEHKVELFGQM